MGVVETSRQFYWLHSGYLIMDRETGEGLWRRSGRGGVEKSVTSPMGCIAGYNACRVQPLKAWQSKVMQTKLMVKLDKSLIDKAKFWAHARQISVSQLVAEVFAQLPDEVGSPALSPWTQRLLGAAKAAGEMSDADVQRDYHRYLEAILRTVFEGGTLRG